jgi:hypothetical protein
VRSILSRFFGLRTTTTRQAPRKKIRPQVEALESRWCPSVTATFHTDVMLITGDDRANRMLIRDSGNGVVSLLQNGQLTHVFSDVRSISVNTAGGDDVVEYEQTGDRTRLGFLSVYLGGGADTFSGFAGRILSGSLLDVAVRGVGGRDGIECSRR